jgi:hypothetical protein
MVKSITTILTPREIRKFHNNFWKPGTQMQNFNNVEEIMLMCRTRTVSYQHQIIFFEFSRDETRQVIRSLTLEN